MEKLTQEIREFWPEFEGFITIYWRRIFQHLSDKGVSGINLPDVDFYSKDGIVAPEFRRETLSMCSPLFEKCIIYDGGARRYQIHEHGGGSGFLGRHFKTGRSDRFRGAYGENWAMRLRSGHEDWIAVNHYQKIRRADTRWLYQQERG